MTENKNAKRCGAEQLIAILSHGRAKSEAYDYIQHILGNPNPAGYAQGDDVVGELEGVEACLAYVRKTWKKVGTADGLVYQLRSQLPDDKNAESLNKESENIPVEDDDPKDDKPIIETSKVHSPPERGNPPAGKITAAEESPGRPDSFKNLSPKPKGRGRQAK